MTSEGRDWHPYLQRAFRFVMSAGRPISALELSAAGINRTTMSQLVASGLVDRPVRGVYHVPSENDDQRVFWAAISVGYEAVFCFTSAAAYHGLTEEGAGIPDVALSEASRVPVRSSFESRVRFHSWPLAAMIDDVDTVTIQGVKVRITSPARTVVDMYRHSTLNHEKGIKPVIMDSVFIDCVSRFITEGDQNERSQELRRIGELHGCWEPISNIASVIHTTRNRMMSF